MAHTIRDKKKLLARIRKIKGQTVSIERALEGGGGCIDVLQQIAAIRGAVNGLMKHVLEGHIREHLGHENISQQERTAEVEEVLGVLRSYLK